MNSLTIEIELGERTVMALLELAKALTQHADAAPGPTSYPPPAPAFARFRGLWDWTPERLTRIDEMVKKNAAPKNIMRALCEMPGEIGSRDACGQKIIQARRRLGVPPYRRTKKSTFRHSVAA